MALSFGFLIASVFTRPSVNKSEYSFAPLLSQLTTGDTKRLPLWIQTGVNCNDDPETAETIIDVMRFWNSTKNWPKLNRLTLEKYTRSEGKYLEESPEYYMAASLTHYLLTIKDEETLRNFGLDIKNSTKGWDRALKKHYDITDMRQLQENWQNFVAEDLRFKLIRIIVNTKTDIQDQQERYVSREETRKLFNKLTLDLDENTGANISYNSNFIISVKGTQELSDELLRAAEYWREKVAQDVFGEQLAKMGLEKFPPGIGQCIVHVDFLGNENLGLTISLDINSEERTRHKMWISCGKKPAVADSTLAHEMVHALLNTLYPGRVPSWAEEGIASHYDDPSRQQTRNQIAKDWIDNRNWPQLKRILDNKENIIASDAYAYIMAIYLNDYLLTKDDMETFLNFSIEGKKIGWDKALKKYYEIKNTDELQQKWQRYMLNLELKP